MPENENEAEEREREIGDKKVPFWPPTPSQ